MRKLMPYANNKCADQPAHSCSLISAFVVHCLDSRICILAKYKRIFMIEAEILPETALS